MIDINVNSHKDIELYITNYQSRINEIINNLHTISFGEDFDLFPIMSNPLDSQNEFIKYMAFIALMCQKSNISLDYIFGLKDNRDIEYQSGGAHKNKRNEEIRTLEATFGKNLRHIREKCGLSQRQLAGKVGISQKRVSEIEIPTSKSCQPLLTHAKIFADILGVSLDELFDENLFEESQGAS